MVSPPRAGTGWALQRVTQRTVPRLPETPLLVTSWEEEGQYSRLLENWADNGPGDSKAQKPRRPLHLTRAGPGLAWGQPHRFFHGSAPRTCRTAVLSSGYTETGERKPSDQVMAICNLLSLTCRLSPRGPGVSASRTNHLCLGRP
jgi:hypothetical protein